MPAALKREPAPEQPPPRKPAAPRERRSKAFPIALGVGLLLAIVAGFALGGGGGDDGGGGGEPQQSSLPVTDAAAGAVRVKVPEGYAEMSSAPALPGLALADAAAYAPGGRDGGRAVAFGRTDANDSTLLPAEFRQAVGLPSGEVPERSAVELGPDALQAYRYENLQPEGADRSVTVYASPTSDGVATVACLAPPGEAAAFKSECEGIANTLQVDAGKTFPVGPDPAYGKLVSATFAKLDREVASGRKALARDGATFRTQAAAASGVQAAYAAAAKRLRGAETSPADTLVNAQLADRLRVSAQAWKKAAAEARAKDKAGFQRAGAGIERAQAKLRQSLRGLDAVGYTTRAR
jgi:hypothetical protein